MAKFSEVLKDKNFFFLWIGQIISQFGDRLNQMALIALIYARAPGSSMQLAKAFSFTIIPVFLVGPFAASYVDRWDRRRTMIVCDLLRAALVMCIALFLVKRQSIWPIYLLVFLSFSASRFFIPAKLAIIPDLVSPEKLLLANSLASTTAMIAMVAGSGLGGLIVEQVGSAGGFFIDSLTFLVSGIFIFFIAARAVSYFTKQAAPAEAPDKKKLFRKTLFADIKEGWQYLLGDKDARSVARVFFILGSALGAIYVVSVVFIQKTLGSVTQDLGILMMFLGAGLFSGTLIYGRFGQRLSKMKMIYLCLGATGVVLSIVTIVLKLFSSILLACGLVFILGMALSPVIICCYTVVHEVTEKKMHGRIFGSLDIVGYLAFFAFMFLSSFLADRIGRFWVLLSVGIALTIVGFGAALWQNTTLLSSEPARRD